MAKNSAGQLRPVFIFQGFDKTRADARGLGQLVHGNFAQLALALQPFTKISLGHEPEPILDKSPCHREAVDYKRNLKAVSCKRNRNTVRYTFDRNAFYAAGSRENSAGHPSTAYRWTNP